MSNVTKGEVGDYVCRAENPAAVRETPAIHLGVHGELHILTLLPCELNLNWVIIPLAYIET